jgi:hypothetical protein
MFSVGLQLVKKGTDRSDTYSIPHTILAFSGGSTMVANRQQHSSRLIAVIAMMAAGKKFPFLFIIKSKQSGCIAKKKLKLYPCLATTFVNKKLGWSNQSGITTLTQC